MAADAGDAVAAVARTAIAATAVLRNKCLTVLPPSNAPACAERLSYKTIIRLEWASRPWNRRSADRSGTAGGYEEAVAERQDHRFQPVVLPHQPRDVPHGLSRLVPLAGIDDRAVPQHVVERDDPARPQHAHAVLEVLRVLGLVGVDEHEVVGRVGEPGQHVQRLAHDQAGARGG